jgi:hypothetical protein
LCCFIVHYFTENDTLGMGGVFVMIALAVHSATPCDAISCVVTSSCVVRRHFVLRLSARTRILQSLCNITRQIPLMLAASWLFYNYMLHVHMSGRLRDFYHRLHADENDCFMPGDMELSTRTLVSKVTLNLRMLLS